MVAGYRPTMLGSALVLGLTALAVGPLEARSASEPLPVEPKPPEPAPEPAVAKERPIRDEFVVTEYDRAANRLVKGKRERKNARRAALMDTGQDHA